MIKAKIVRTSEISLMKYVLRKVEECINLCKLPFRDIGNIKCMFLHRSLFFCAVFKLTICHKLFVFNLVETFTVKGIVKIIILVK